jgi:hypothetical protein
MHVAIGPQWTENALGAAALRRMRPSNTQLIPDTTVAAGVQQVGQSIQAGAALALSVSQQAFKHAAGFRVTGVIPARVTPFSKIPIGGTG